MAKSMNKIREEVRARREMENAERARRVKEAEELVDGFFSSNGNSNYKNILMFALSTKRYDSGNTLRDMVILEMANIVDSYKKGDAYEMDRIIEHARLFGLV